MTRGFPDQAPAGSDARVGGADRRQPVDIELRIGEVLIGGEPSRAGEHDVAGRRRHDDRAFEGDKRLRVRGRAILVGGAVLRRPSIRVRRGVETAAEAPQIGVDRLAVGADRVLERRRGDRHAPAARDQPEHDRVDHRAALLGERVHVEKEMALRMGLDRLDQAGAVVAAVAHRHLLHHQIGARGRGDHQRAIGRDETAGDGAARFHELARQHDVDVADAGRERQHQPSGKLVRRQRHDLDVVGGGAGALGDAGDGGRLHRKTELRDRADDPVREHAAAFAAERGDENGDR